MEDNLTTRNKLAKLRRCVSRVHFAKILNFIPHRHFDSNFPLWANAKGTEIVKFVQWGVIAFWLNFLCTVSCCVKLLIRSLAMELVWPLQASLTFHKMSALPKFQSQEKVCKVLIEIIADVECLQGFNRNHCWCRMSIKANNWQKHIYGGRREENDNSPLWEMGGDWRKSW